MREVYRSLPQFMLSLSTFTNLALGANLLAQVPLLNALALVQQRQTGTLDNFTATELPIALQGILDNIGPAGILVPGAAPGLVIASPTQNNPDYFDTWTRDSALTFKALVDAFIAGNTSLQPLIESYIYAQAQLQAVPNLSGNLSTGAGLSEPKFEADGTAFNAPWGRPQFDGPALRATTLVAYSRWLLSNGGTSFVSDVIWPILSNDLNFIGQYWNETNYDLWEETLGSSFFATAVQHRALVEGNAIAQAIGQQCPGCVSQAPQILCFLQSYWNGTFLSGYLNTDDSNRTRINLNTILGVIHTFDPTTTCDTTTFQPCSDIALANHKVVTDSFRSVYAINAGIPQGQGVGVGRYPEDFYQGGNPWYLGSLAAAEQLYDALYQWSQIRSLEVSTTSLAFFQDLLPSVTTGTYDASTETYATLTAAVRTYADSYMLLVEKYVPSDGTLAEQFSRDDGTPLSASNLTWSYASFLTAVAACNGEVSASWGEASGRDVPTTCLASSAQGTYFTPTVTSPVAPCTTVTSVAVQFNLADSTTFGESVLISGSVPELGDWDPTKAIPLSAFDYQEEYPRWYVTVDLPAGTNIQYKYINQQPYGSIVWETGDNREYTVPMGCAEQVEVHDSWQ